MVFLDDFSTRYICNIVKYARWIHFFKYTQFDLFLENIIITLPLSVCDVILHDGGTCRKCVWHNTTQSKYLQLLALCLMKYCIMGLPLPSNSTRRLRQLIKWITYLSSEIAERRQKSHTSDDTVKVTPKKRYQLGIEKVSLNGVIKCSFLSNRIFSLSQRFN